MNSGDNGEICAGNSICERMTGKCVCPIDLIHRDKQCVERIHVGPGSRCDSSDFVCSRESICNPSTGICVCPSTHVHVQQVGDACLFKSQKCLRNAGRLFMLILEIGVLERNENVLAIQSVTRVDVPVRLELVNNIECAFRYPRVRCPNRSCNQPV